MMPLGLFKKTESITKRVKSGKEVHFPPQKAIKEQLWFDEPPMDLSDEEFYRTLQLDM
jgi:hypothetical protein